MAATRSAVPAFSRAARALAEAENRHAIPEQDLDQSEHADVGCDLDRHRAEPAGRGGGAREPGSRERRQIRITAPTWPGSRSWR